MHIHVLHSVLLPHCVAMHARLIVARSSRLVASADVEIDLLRLCAATDRGQQATEKERARLIQLAATLESNAPEITGEAQLNGRWRLLFASEAPYRSSPFFSAFRRCTKGMVTPLAVGSSVQAGDPWASAVYAVTDAIPFYDIGAVYQTIQGVCDETQGQSDGATSIGEPSDGTSATFVLPTPTLVSEVTLNVARNFGLPAMSSIMTTTCMFEVSPAFAGGTAIDLMLSIETTAAEQSTIAALVPGLDQALTFPSGRVLETLKEGSSKVPVRISYLSPSLRIARPLEYGQEPVAVFVYTRKVG